MEDAKYMIVYFRNEDDSIVRVIVNSPNLSYYFVIFHVNEINELKLIDAYILLQNAAWQR